MRSGVVLPHVMMWECLLQGLRVLGRALVHEFNRAEITSETLSNCGCISLYVCSLLNSKLKYDIIDVVFKTCFK